MVSTVGFGLRRGFPDADTDYMGQWHKIWEEQWVNNGPVSIVSFLMKQAIENSIVGDVVQTLLRIFFPAKFDSKFEVMRYLMDWTKRYVEVAMIEQVGWGTSDHPS